MQAKKEEILQMDKEKAKVLHEELESAKQKGMYDGVWSLYDQILKREQELERTKRR